MVNRLIICAIFLQLFINCSVFGQNGSDEKYGNEITIQKINDFMEKTEINELKYKELSKRWMEKDTSISINDITFLRCYFTTTPEYNPIKIDELSAQIYNLNKTEKFQVTRLCLS